MQHALAPSSSRMLAGYLTDIEQLLDAQCRDAAVRDACDLPHIAVALTDPELRCSGEQLRTWCQQWIGPSTNTTRQPRLDYERVGRNVTARVKPDSSASVPAGALRRLRMRRYVRMRPRGYFTDRSGKLAAHETEAVELCTALIEATRRWYARCACHDSTVQTNLARLAVLR
jgi:hypothetical protein